MNKDEIKNILVKFGVVTLLTGVGFDLGGCATSERVFDHIINNPIPMPSPRYS